MIIRSVNLNLTSTGSQGNWLVILTFTVLAIIHVLLQSELGVGCRVNPRTNSSCTLNRPNLMHVDIRSAMAGSHTRDNTALDAEPPIASFLKSMLIGGGRSTQSLSAKTARTFLHTMHQSYSRDCFVAHFDRNGLQLDSTDKRERF